jgi:hypothetical protein
LAQAEAAPRARAPLHAVDASLLVTLPAPLLGEGSYGRVHYGSYDGAEVAVKVLQLDARDAAPAVVAGFRREAELLCALSHPNILRVYGVVEGAEGAAGGGGGGVQAALSLVVDLAEGGSLECALRGGAAPALLPPAAARRVALGVARALAYLHSRADPVAHNDLKSGNVLLDGKGNALLADFGVSRAVGGSLKHTHGAATARGDRGAVGTVAWMAPENGDPEDANYLKLGADMYSFGMLLFELITGRPPWEGLSMGQINAAVMRGRRPPLPAGADAELAGLITACWAQDPAARPTAATAVARLAAMEWGRGGGERTAPGAAWTQRLRDARAAAGRDTPTPAAAVEGGGAAELPAAMAALSVGGAAAPPPPQPAAPSPPRAAAAVPREMPAAAMGAARVVALMREGAADAGMARAGAEALRDIAVSDAGRAACVAAGAQAAVVAALTSHAGVAAVCEQGCGALKLIAGNDGRWRGGSAACVAAEAPRAVVAALTTHAGVAAVCNQGCGALANIARNKACGAACVAAGAVAPLVAALARHPGDVRKEAHSALEKLGYRDDGSQRGGGAGGGGAAEN